MLVDLLFFFDIVDILVLGLHSSDGLWCAKMSRNGTNTFRNVRALNLWGPCWAGHCHYDHHTVFLLRRLQYGHGCIIQYIVKICSRRKSEHLSLYTKFKMNRLGVRISKSPQRFRDAEARHIGKWAWLVRRNTLLVTNLVSLGQTVPLNVALDSVGSLCSGDALVSIMITLSPVNSGMGDWLPSGR